MLCLKVAKIGIALNEHYSFLIMCFTLFLLLELSNQRKNVF